MATNTYGSPVPSFTSIGWNQAMKPVLAPSTFLAGRQSGVGVDRPAYYATIDNPIANRIERQLIKAPGARNITEAIYGYDPTNAGAQRYISPGERLTRLGTGALQLGTWGIGGFAKPLLAQFGLDKFTDKLIKPTTWQGNTMFPTEAQTRAKAEYAAANPTDPSLYKSFYEYRKANPTSDAAKAVGQVDAILAGMQAVANTSLSPAEKLAYEQAAESLRRNAGQAAATDALQKKQAQAQASRGILDIRQFTGGTLQDVAGAMADAGFGDVSAGGMGAERSALQREATGINEINTNLAEWLARQNLSAGQRGSDVAYGLKALREQAAKALETKRQEAAMGRGLTVGG